MDDWLNEYHYKFSIGANDPIFDDPNFMSSIVSHEYYDSYETIRGGRMRTVHFPPGTKQEDLVEEGTRDGTIRPTHVYCLPSGLRVIAGGGGPSDRDTVKLKK